MPEPLVFLHQRRSGVHRARHSGRGGQLLEHLGRPRGPKRVLALLTLGNTSASAQLVAHGGYCDEAPYLIHRLADAPVRAIERPLGVSALVHRGTDRAAAVILGHGRVHVNVVHLPLLVNDRVRWHSAAIKELGGAAHEVEVKDLAGVGVSARRKFQIQTQSADRGGGAAERCQGGQGRVGGRRGGCR